MGNQSRKDKTVEVSFKSPDWRVDSWRQLLSTADDFDRFQQPRYSDREMLENVIAQLSDIPGLVFVNEVRQLEKDLAEVCRGRGFVLQAGDCAEPFGHTVGRPKEDRLADYLKVFWEMSSILAYGAGVPVINIGRVAGQFAKPRSSLVEKRQGVELPSFRGHIINDVDFNEMARQVTPIRMIEAYNQAVTTLNLIRGMSQRRSQGPVKFDLLNQGVIDQSLVAVKHQNFIRSIQLARRGIEVWGLTSPSNSRSNAFYTSHEGLLLNWEEALTRQEPSDQKWYALSAHMLWIGLRTHQLDGPHVEFMRGISNPIGCKIGPASQPEEVVRLCQVLNPGNIPGRLTLISRMGADNIKTCLPPIIKAIKKNSLEVVWQCDPMHGNTFKTDSGIKTRRFEVIMAEIDAYLNIHKRIGTWPGGIHLEMTGDNVTECLGGAVDLDESDLDDFYQTLCDPRLNSQQGLELALLIAKSLLD